ncbi:MAG: indole-3-glycerol-phosphate synthase [Gammaproteobacteria bacterium]|nr:indole-3-glycerol-phosphate synthase [Gammaproteobacteria bacterium]
MSGFLDEMARRSRQRADAAVRRESLGELERRATGTAPPPPLMLSAAGFDVIAEIKLRSPAAGVLGHASDDWLGRATAYARAGAAAVSVLTEPSRFDGSLEHLARAAAALAPLGIPAMRKDFLVDPYQVIEARAQGAGGVLLILRMLSAAQAAEMLDSAFRHGLFVLLEAFDRDELERAGRLAAEHAGRGLALAGLNCRDLQTLEVVPGRFAELAASLPGGAATVAESGVADVADAVALRRLGYRLALIGSALMTCADPAAFIRDVLRAARNLSAQNG